VKAGKGLPQFAIVQQPPRRLKTASDTTIVTDLKLTPSATTILLLDQARALCVRIRNLRESQLRRAKFS
jgi:hypothetical protein